jgi:hypothetical protein
LHSTDITAPSSKKAAGKTVLSAAPQSLSTRALSTPEPLVRAFSRRVQQEGALDLTQGDYKNADFAPHPEVVRAAQRRSRSSSARAGRDSAAGSNRITRV